MQIADLLCSVPHMQTSYSTRECPVCGKKIPPVEFKIGDRTFYGPLRCECEIKAYNEAEQRRIDAEKRARISKYFDMSELGDKHADSTFEDYEVRPGNRRWFETAKAYAENLGANIESGRGLMVLGNPGNGKSHLLAAIGRVAQEQNHTVVIRSVPVLLKRFQATYNRDNRTNEDDLLEVLREVDLLGLDDLGAERTSEWAQSQLYYLIDERYRWRKSVIVTSNATLEELEIRVGARTLDRLCEMCDLVQNTAPSHRMERAKARMKGGK